MEDNEILLKKQTTGGVIISACGLWVNIALISFVVLLLSFCLCLHNMNNNFFVFEFLCFVFCQFYCLRLNLDAKLFKILFDNIEELDSFDSAIEKMFNRNKQSRTIEHRILGTKRLLNNSILLLLVQIILVFLIFIKF